MIEHARTSAELELGLASGSLGAAG
jgi:hypothetical protein